MADSITSISNMLENSIPKITIQRIVLETGATESKTAKDPHIVTPDQFAGAPTPNADAGLLKVDLTLSLIGYRKRNIKSSDLLSTIFGNVDLLGLTTTTVYQFDSAAMFELLATEWSPQALSLYGVNDIPFQTINILEELTSMSETDLSRFEQRTSDGSTLFNFPFKLETFTISDPNPKFLAYMVKTEINHQALKNHIKAALGTLGPAGPLASNVEEYLDTVSSSLTNKTVSFDVVIDNNMINNQASLLTRDNGAIWWGAYHEMADGTLMTGNAHNDLGLVPEHRDKVLKPILMPNTKIIDLRDDEEVEKVFLKELYELESVFETIQKTTNQQKTTNEKLELPEKFSTSFMSKNDAGVPSYLFGIDIFKILANNSLLARIGQNLLKSNAEMSDIKETILDASNIKEFKISRRRVKVNNFGTNRLGTLNVDQESFKHNILDADITNSYEDDIPKGIIVHPDGLKKIEALNFIYDGMHEKRFLFYSFNDPELATFTNGNYEYFYELVIEDGILKTLTQKLTSLISFYGEIKAYYNFISANITECYDEPHDQFRISFISAAGYAEISDVLANAIGEMADIMKMFSLYTSSVPMQNNLMTISHPTSGNMQGLMKLMGICETFIVKIQNISGIKTNILDHIDKGTPLQINFTELRNTIKISEVFPDNANVEEMDAGYEYLITNKFSEALTAADSANSIRTIPAATYLAMATAQLEENFLPSPGAPDMGAFTSIGNVNNPNNLRYFTPTQVRIGSRKYFTNAQAGLDPIVLKPFRLNFDYYKPIILDIIEFYLNRKIEGNTASTTLKGNIKRLIDIASRYGVVFDNDFVNQLGYLTDPGANKDSSEYSDSSIIKTQQQSSESTGTGLSPLGTLADPSDMPDYEDNSYESDLNLNIENFLFGMLSNIILEDENLVPNAYQPPPGADVVDFSNLPSCLGALSVQLSTLFVSLNQPPLAGPFSINFDLLKEFPLSLSTIGWWWFNYSNIVEVRYIKSYNLNDRFSTPVWAPLTSEEFYDTVASSAPKRIICKLFKYENSDLGATSRNKFLDLPMLNRHFIITPDGTTAVTAQEQSEAFLAINQEDEKDTTTKVKEDLDSMQRLSEDNPQLNSVLNGDNRLIKNEAAIRVDAYLEENARQSEQRQGGPRPQAGRGPSPLPSYRGDPTSARGRPQSAAARPSNQPTGADRTDQRDNNRQENPDGRSASTKTDSSNNRGRNSSDPYDR